MGRNRLVGVVVVVVTLPLSRGLEESFNSVYALFLSLSRIVYTCSLHGDGKRREENALLRRKAE